MAKEKITVGASRQVSALARKALSYQKRQMFTNICCIALCPFIMVGLSALLGSFITGLIQKASPINGFMYCSNIDAMNSINIPYWGGPSEEPRLPTTGNENIPGAFVDKVYHVNWARVTGALGLSGPPGAQASNFIRACTQWFGEEYPYSDLYERDPNTPGESPAFIKDSTYYSQPLSGWIGALSQIGNDTFDALSLRKFINSQQRTESLVSAAPGVDYSLIGVKDKEPIIAFENFPSLAASPPNLGENSAGLLSSIVSRYFVELDLEKSNPIVGFVPTPWYNISTMSVFELDDAISSYIQNVVTEIAAVEKSDLLTRDPEKTNRVFLKVGQIINKLPHGCNSIY
jgi:hypothetical protein